MHVTLTDFRDLARSVMNIGKKRPFWLLEGRALSSWNPTKKVANRLLGFPSVHITEWRESFCTNFT